MIIKELKIYTAHLNKQRKFYSEILGLAVLSSTDDEARFQLGETILILIQSEHFQPYHFAINIPCNQEQQALNWLKERVEILKSGEIEIQDFDFWNAKAIYFYDEDKNIVELIARKNLKNESSSSFSAESLLSISEIGVPVDNVESTYNSISKVVNADIFSGSFESFLALGDENGLFICINKNKRDWFPTNDKAHSSEFELVGSLDKTDFRIQFKGGIINSITVG